METPLSNETIDSVLRHREVGRAKDLSAPPLRKIQSSAVLVHNTFQFRNAVCKETGCKQAQDTLKLTAANLVRCVLNLFKTAVLQIVVFVSSVKGINEI